MSTPFFILGARDMEMNAIEKLLTSLHIKWYGAGFDKVRAHPGNAYEARNLINAPSSIQKGGVGVECHVVGWTFDAKIDHHNEGDPGYDLPPEQYLEAASIGQVAKYLNIELSEENKYLAAGDHCLYDAYRGKCPGIDPDRLMHIRAERMAEYSRISAEEMMERLRYGTAKMYEAERVVVGQQEVLFCTDQILHLQEISAREGVPVMYIMDQQDGRKKIGILNAEFDTINEWMNTCQLNHVYGNPHRRYAGGYV